MKALIFLGDFQYIYETLGKLDNYYKILIFDQKNKKSASVDTLNRYFNEVIEVEDLCKCRAELEKIVSEIVQVRTVMAIYATVERLVEVGGFLREKFAIPGINEAQADMLRNKLIMKETVRKSGVKVAECRAIRSVGDISEFINIYGYPVIFKPAYGYGSSHTHKISSPAELKRIENEYSDGLISGEFIVERFIEGTEYHCDSIIFNGQILFSSVGKYLDNCLEMAVTNSPVGTIIFPEHLKDSNESTIVSNIKKLNEKVICAFNIRNSICHMEVFITPSGEVFFSEIGARVGGGYIGLCIKNTYNIDLYEAYVNVELELLNLECRKDKNVYTGVVTFPVKEGEICSISSCEQFNNIEGFVKAEIFSKKGDVLKSKCSTMQRTGYLILEDKSYEGLYKKLVDANNAFELEVSGL